MYTLRVKFDERYGTPIADGQAEEIAESLIPYAGFPGTRKEDPKVVCFSTANVIYAIRLLVKKGKMNYRRIVFECGGEEININKNGDIPIWPVGFADFDTRMLIQLL